MNESRGRGLVTGVVLLGFGMIESASAGGVGDDPPALEGPSARGDLLPTPPPPPPIAMVVGPTHEALRENGAEAGGVALAPKSPPPPIAERPTDDRPGPDARWVPGYWTWDTSRADFHWVTGVWRVPPPETIWVNGRWRRDERGWARVPGFWSARQGQDSTRQANWRTTGPPADRPADEPGQAPDPNAFYVPGHYRPEGDRLAWTSGFWSSVHPGWDWVPSRWVRRPDGWEYRDGYWTRDRGTARHEVARPRNGDDLPAAIVESEPSLSGPGNLDRRPPPGDRDPIDEGETLVPVRDPLVVTPRVAPYPGVIVVPRSGYYYRPMRGPYYDPLNVTPPFVRRLLDRVMP